MKESEGYADAGSKANAGTSGKAQTVNVVLEADNQPYTYEDDNGKPAGYEYEVLKAVDKKLDQYHFKYQVLDYETAQAGLESGKYDLLSGCKFRTPVLLQIYLVFFGLPKLLEPFGIDINSWDGRRS